MFVRRKSGSLLCQRVVRPRRCHWSNSPSASYLKWNGLAPTLAESRRSLGQLSISILFSIGSGDSHARLIGARNSGLGALTSVRRHVASDRVYPNVPTMTLKCDGKVACEFYFPGPSKAGCRIRLHGEIIVGNQPIASANCASDVGHLAERFHCVRSVKFHRCREYYRP